MYPINPLELNFINKLLQINRTAPSLQEYHKKAKNVTILQFLKYGLLKYQEQLVVVEEQNLRTQLITKIYTQVSTAYPKKIRPIGLLATATTSPE